VRDWIASHTDSGIPAESIIPAANPVPDSDQVLLEQWLAAVRDVQQAQKAVALGIFDTSSAFYTTPFGAMMSIWNGATVAQKAKGIRVLP
jgi:hypothetical protein